MKIIEKITSMLHALLSNRMKSLEIGSKRRHKTWLWYH